MIFSLGEEIANKVLMPCKTSKLPKGYAEQVRCYARNILRLGDDTKVCHAIYEILYRQRDQQQSHDANENPDSGLAHSPRYAVRVSQNQVADRCGDEDR